MSIIDKANKLLIIIVVCSAGSVCAADEAEQLFEAGNFAAAADAYAHRTQIDPEDVNAWFQLAVSARQAGRHEIARDALDQAGKRQYSPVSIGLERARLDVLAGDVTAAVAELDALARRGFTGVGIVSGDPILATLAGNDAYDALLAGMARQAFPCEHDAAFSAFDFWVGDWDVHAANGSYLGSNRIESVEHGCLLTEQWSSASGTTGTSINYLDRISGEWVQIWNDASGNQINIRGGMTGEGMRLTGTIHYVASATTAQFRGLWTPLPDGRVRQFFEQLSADGETWSPWFEGFYSRKSVD